MQVPGYRDGLSDQRFLVWLGDGPGLEGDGFPRPNERRGRRPLLQSILGNRGSGNLGDRILFEGSTLLGVIGVLGKSGSSERWVVLWPKR